MHYTCPHKTQKINIFRPDTYIWAFVVGVIYPSMWAGRKTKKYILTKNNSVESSAEYGSGGGDGSTAVSSTWYCSAVCIKVCSLRYTSLKEKRKQPCIYTRNTKSIRTIHSQGQDLESGLVISIFFTAPFTNGVILCSLLSSRIRHAEYFGRSIYVPPTTRS